MIFLRNFIILLIINQIHPLIPQLHIQNCHDQYFLECQLEKIRSSDTKRRKEEKEESDDEKDDKIAAKRRSSSSSSLSQISRANGILEEEEENWNNVS